MYSIKETKYVRNSKLKATMVYKQNFFMNMHRVILFEHIESICQSDYDRQFIIHKDFTA